jgi:hypothetical protein
MIAEPIFQHAADPGAGKLARAEAERDAEREAADTGSRTSRAGRFTYANITKDRRRPDWS